MRYDFDKMDADSFELMVRSLNEKIFGIKCEQYGLGPDGQREFTFEGEVTDSSGTVFSGRTMGQVKYKYPVTKDKDYDWLVKEIRGELKRFREKDRAYIPDNYLFYTNVVLTPEKDKGVKDRINQFIKENNDVIPHFYIKGYDEICALLDNNRDVATCYACHILPGDVLAQFLKENRVDYSEIIQKYLARELEEDMYTRMEQSGSVTEKKISIEKVCVDIDVKDREKDAVFKLAEKVLSLGNKVLGYRKENSQEVNGIYELDRDENFVLLGGPGRGKTTICQFIAQIYRANYLQTVKYRNAYSASFMQEIEESYSYQINCRRIPFKITLKEYAAWISRQGEDADISIIQYMKARIRKIEGEDLSIRAVRDMFTQLAWIFFFDGLDEVPETSNRQEVLKQIRSFIAYDLREAKCDCMIIGTTRMQGYNNDFDESHYKHLEVMELSEEDCKKYFIKLFQVMEEQTEMRERYIDIMKEALQDDTACRLMKTPLQVTIIAILVKSGGKPPHERYSLFLQYYETTVKREKMKGIIPTLNDNTDWLEAIHLLVADRLQRESEKDSNPSAEISRADLIAIIHQYIESNKDEFYESAQTLENKEADFLKIITERICFIGENRDDFYSFSIRTMQEFFAGTSLVKNVKDEEAMQKIRRVAHLSYWRNALLFAFGYIEIEKKHLEEDIGALCEVMNGRDNLGKSEYTSDNICLYGSWLAIDILAEDIFKGNQQNKYIKCAAKAVALSDCAMFTNFKYVTGIQCDKLRKYVKEEYEGKKEYREGVLALYMKLNENEKNDMEKDVVSLLQGSDEEERVRFCVKLLDKGVRFRDRRVKEWESVLVESIGKGEWKQDLPHDVLERTLRDKELCKDIGVKRFLLLQCIRDAHISTNLLQNIFKIRNKDTIYGCFRIGLMRGKRRKIEITEDFSYYFYDEQYIQDAYSEFQKIAEEMKLTYLVKFCEFVANPSYVKYKELLSVIGSDEEYAVKTYFEKIYFGLGELTEEEFQHNMEDRLQVSNLMKEETIDLLMTKNIDCCLGTIAICDSMVFDDLLENGNYTLDKIDALSNRFLKSYIFAAGTQVENTDIYAKISKKTADGLIRLLEIANDRKIFFNRLFIIILFIVQSKFIRKLLESVPDLYFIDKMSDTQLATEIFRVRCHWPTPILSKLITDIVRFVADLGKENHYLHLLLWIFARKEEIVIDITPDEREILENITYQNAYNQCAVYLLKLCSDQDANQEELLSALMHLNVDKNILYSVMSNLLCKCDIPHKDQVWVQTYFYLAEEEFEGCKEIRRKMIDDMLDKKGNCQ